MNNSTNDNEVNILQNTLSNYLPKEIINIIEFLSLNTEEIPLVIEKHFTNYEDDEDKVEETRQYNIYEHISGYKIIDTLTTYPNELVKEYIVNNMINLNKKFKRTYKNLKEQTDYVYMYMLNYLDSDSISKKKYKRLYPIYSKLIGNIHKPLSIRNVIVLNLTQKKCWIHLNYREDSIYIQKNKVGNNSIYSFHIMEIAPYKDKYKEFREGQFWVYSERDVINSLSLFTDNDEILENTKRVLQGNIGKEEIEINLYK